MTVERPTRPVLGLHLLLCVVALIVGLLVFGNVFHVNLHEGVGLIIAVVAILLAL